MARTGVWVSIFPNSFPYINQYKKPSAEGELTNKNSSSAAIPPPKLWPLSFLTISFFFPNVFFFIKVIGIQIA